MGPIPIYTPAPHILDTGAPPCYNGAMTDTLHHWITERSDEELVFLVEDPNASGPNATLVAKTYAALAQDELERRALVL